MDVVMLGLLLVCCVGVGLLTCWCSQTLAKKER